ncbi:hypothetical protein VNO77_02791 [Canavalia gladiata]|uniref:Uncharacterized protein n=1 Tax=Canavalia gladiata TaxID=3824 RepID=A0AAN9MYL1_CANGL
MCACCLGCSFSSMHVCPDHKLLPFANFGNQEYAHLHLGIIERLNHSLVLEYILEQFMKSWPCTCMSLSCKLGHQPITKFQTGITRHEGMIGFLELYDTMFEYPSTRNCICKGAMKSSGFCTLDHLDFVLDQGRPIVASLLAHHFVEFYSFLANVVHSGYAKGPPGYAELGPTDYSLSSSSSHTHKGLWLTFILHACDSRTGFFFLEVKIKLEFGVLAKTVLPPFYVISGLLFSLHLCLDIKEGMGFKNRTSLSLIALVDRGNVPLGHLDAGDSHRIRIELRLVYLNPKSSPFSSTATGTKPLESDAIPPSRKCHLLFSYGQYEPLSPRPKSRAFPSKS